MGYWEKRNYMKKNKGQTLIEYSILIMILLAVFVAMNTYVKRGIQGRWKSSVDGMGDQYDPKTANSLVTYYVTSNSSSMVSLGQDSVTGNPVTNRADTSSSSETKTEKTAVN